MCPEAQQSGGLLGLPVGAGAAALATAPRRWQLRIPAKGMAVAIQGGGELSADAIAGASPRPQHGHNDRGTTARAQRKGQHAPAQPR